MIERLFHVKKHGSDIKTEIIAGFVTFMTMAYIIAVNPIILSGAGIPMGGVIFATCLAAAVGTLLMGISTNYPIALASGMGLNVYFVIVVCRIEGVESPWRVGLGAVFLSGVIFLLASIFNFHKVILKAIPHSLRLAIAAGIGLLIAYLGLYNGQIVVAVVKDGGFDRLALGPISNPSFIVTLFGVLFTAVLMGKKI
ncbi:solute carrier family 23 protein, partial [Acidobacteriota bacterium]